MSVSEKSTSRPRTSAELEHEVESTRAGLTATLDELRDRMSPGQLLDQVFDFTKESRGSEFATSLGHSVRANPVPTLLIGAGLAWLLASASSRSPDEDADTAEVADRRGSRGGMAADARHTTSAVSARGLAAEGFTKTAVLVSSGAKGVGVKPSAAYQAAAGAVEQATTMPAGGAVSADRSIRTAGSLARRIVMGSVSEYGGSTAHRVYDEAQQLFDNTREGIDTMIEKQPLVIGALGIAIGAAIGAALPSTSAENRWMGERSDELKRRVREIAEEQYDNAREVAGQIYEEVRDEIEMQDLAALPAEVIAQVTERVRTAAEGASSTAKESAKEAVGEVKKAVNGASEESKSPASNPRKEAGSAASRSAPDFKTPGT